MRIKWALFLIIGLYGCVHALTARAATPEDIERAGYWAERGHSFDPNYLTAWEMDQKVKDIERAGYWAERGHSFDPNYLTAWEMDQKVKDIERAGYWAERGHSFDPDYLTAWEMDQKVKDIERAGYWAERGHSFDPNYLTAWEMDRAIEIRREPSGTSRRPSSRSSFDWQILLPSPRSAVSPELSSWPSFLVLDYKGRLVPRVAENGTYYGEISPLTNRPKVVHVEGYYRNDGTYVRGHYRSRPKP